jgi:hypothetical protein
MNRSTRHSYTTNWFRGLLACSLAAALLWSVPRTDGDEPKPGDKEASKETTKPAEAGPLEVRFNDGSVLKMTFKDEKIEVVTPYGKLLVPVADVYKIDFATRIPEADAKRVEAALAKLGSSEFDEREAATAELLKLREKAYPALVQTVAKTKDAETKRRVEGLLEKIREEVPEDQLETRPHDVIYTEHSKIAGKISAAALKANTTQFGELQVKLSDVRVLRSPLAPDDEPVVKDAPDPPPSMMAMQNQIGKTFVYKVTGAVVGTVWGTNVYTADSTLAAAAVHAGLLKVGQTGIIKVKMIPSPNNYVGSTQNGVMSHPYNVFPAAYTLSK